MMPKRHVVVGGGTAGLNAMLTIREHDRGSSQITLVSTERPYARMVLPYYLGRTIAESHLFTLTPPRLAQLKVQTHFGRRAVRLDANANRLNLDDGTILEYDDLLIATGSSAVRASVVGSDLPGVHTFWALPQARNLLAAIRAGSHVVIVGGGFIAFTLLNAILALRARLTIVELAPHILPRMIDRAAADMVTEWLLRRGVAVRAGVNLARIEDLDGRKHLRFHQGESLTADVVIMATGIHSNLEWLEGSAVRMNRGVLVDDHLRASVPNIYAAGDVAEGPDAVSGQPAVHAIEPTAMEHGRVAGANMAGGDVAYRGSLLMNIVDLCRLTVASIGAWDDPTAEAFVVARPERSAYRKLLWRGDRLIGAMIVGRANDVWATNDVGMLKGLVQSGTAFGAWKDHLRRNPFDIKRAFIALGSTAQLLPLTTIGRRPPLPADSPLEG
ncbi:MAG TPA: FAD-dependent oxidoreductase [Candidatus Methylomirabilis sp.]|nr:FAD-dependent oxidoreductase [Candidatus Methylomirabilis sp.]